MMLCKILCEKPRYVWFSNQAIDEEPQRQTQIDSVPYWLYIGQTPSITQSAPGINFVLRLPRLSFVAPSHWGCQVWNQTVTLAVCPELTRMINIFIKNHKKEKKAPVSCYFFNITHNKLTESCRCGLYWMMQVWAILNDACVDYIE